MHERSLINVKVAPRSTSRTFYLASILFTSLKIACVNVRSKKTQKQRKHLVMVPATNINTAFFDLHKVDTSPMKVSQRRLLTQSLTVLLNLETDRFVQHSYNFLAWL